MRSRRRRRKRSGRRRRRRPAEEEDLAQRLDGRNIAMLVVYFARLRWLAEVLPTKTNAGRGGRAIFLCVLPSPSVLALK
jgi:hypothetical protein